MEETKYKYLFPYEKIPPRSRIIIYGAGTLGQDYYTQMSITHYCEVVGFVDKNYKKYANSLIPVFAPNEISEISFDYVVIALRMKAAYNEIRNILIEAKVPEAKIVAVFERQYNEEPIFEEVDYFEIEFAYKDSLKSIALLTTGGFGDMVIQKRLVMEIISLEPDCSVDIYNIKAFDFLKTLYADIPNVKNIIPDLGSRYRTKVREYSLGLTIEACHFINVDIFNEDIWNSEDIIFAEKIRLLMERTKEENVGISTPAHVTMYRRWYKGYNAYTGFNYDGVFHIANKKVNIPLNENARRKFLELNLFNYITINCGNGDCSDASLVAKSWPLENYNILIEKIKNKFSSINIVQLGEKNATNVKDCDLYLLGEDFLLVEHVLKNSLLHIDIEGGLVHIASQLGTKCVVLFGPTVAEYYGYDNNINIRVGNCRNCWGLYTDVNKCARGMEHPECMYSITPDVVFEEVRKELETNES